MDWLLALLLSAASGPPPATVAVRAQARIMIVQGHKAASETWTPAARRNQREIVRQEMDGSRVRLRITEFE